MSGNGEGEPAGNAGWADLLALGADLAADRLIRPGRSDPGRITCDWARRVLNRTHQDDVRVRIGKHAFLLVAAGETSARILEASPAADAYPPGNLKRDAMRFLAPRALTIAHGDDWVRLRAFNEGVLSLHDADPLAQPFLDCTRAAFTEPVRSRTAVRAAMARAMVGIVFGAPPDACAELARDVHVLFGVVQSPVRRKLLGFAYRNRRERLYRALADRWRAARAGEPSLLGAARRTADAGSTQEILEQLPHWMFTFTGSGTDLLTRTLAMITSRGSVLGRVLGEIAAAGPGDRVETISRLSYTRACLLETGRLFPPVTRTFHRGQEQEADAEVVHYLPLLQRDESLGPSVHDFRPERWLGAAPDPAAAASNLFLRGPRACPGRDLMLFVCTAALARQLDELGLATRTTRLSHDPLPVTFPERAARFRSRGRADGAPAEHGRPMGRATHAEEST